MPPHPPLIRSLVSDWGNALQKLHRSYPDVACLPAVNILPQRTYDNVAVIECLQDREQHTSYVTAWLPDDSGYPVYLIYLFEKQEDESQLKGMFEGISKYYDYCREHLNDTVNRDFGNTLQYEYLL